jgi:hypothetical protein
MAVVAVEDDTGRRSGRGPSRRLTAWQRQALTEEPSLGQGCEPVEG